MHPVTATCVVAATVALGISACGPAISTPQPARVTAAQGSLTLDQAMRHGRDLGPVAQSLHLTVTLALAGRNDSALEAIVASGGHVSAAQMAARYSPDPDAVARVRAVLEKAGMTTQWTTGRATMTVSGSAAAVDRVFQTSLHDYVSPNGLRFHAPVAPVRIPAMLRPTVLSAIGFDNFPAIRYSTLMHNDGLEPQDVAAIYDINPLTKSHLDGSGVTVVFPEGSLPQKSVLDSFANQFGLPPFDLTVKTDPSWGTPDKPGDQHFDAVDAETEMDIEIVHEIAPAAKEIVYAGGSDVPLPTMYQAIADTTSNVIVSSSLGINDCESKYPNEEAAFDKAWKQMAAEGTTAYDASGDYGAFCEPGTLGIYPDVASPNVTSVGATTVFQAANGGYGSEAAWGDPIDQIGTGGGVSQTFAMPAWQQAPGVQAARSNGKRQVPDVAAPGDPISPYATLTLRGPSPGDGTSAAAPFWAGITALIDQDLAQKHLDHPGLMAPLLYTFAQQPQGIPNNPFHDVVQGSNLNDVAGPGWDMATGLGTPDVARLADDVEWYEQTHRQGSS